MLLVVESTPVAGAQAVVAAAVVADSSVDQLKHGRLKNTTLEASGELS